jgi:YbgC/YbaW family acyl-CoA thioester hydrolase
MSLSNRDNLFTHITHVRIDDINFGNHLCHSKFINIIHNARALFLKKHNISESNCFGYKLIMLNLNIDYISECFFNDRLEITLGIDKLEKAKFSLKYSVFNHTSNKLAAKATTLMGFLDIEKGTLKRIPLEFSKLVDIVDNT